MAIVNKSKYENIYEISPLQSGLLFQSLYQPESDAYFVQHIFELQNVDIDHWYKVWRIVINRHDSLKANFVWEKLSKPLQRIQNEVDPAWLYEDWSQDIQHETRLKTLIQSERKKRFDLTRSPLMRFNLIRRDNERHYFIWNIHHLLVDGWSIPIVLEDVITAYQLSISNEPIRLKARRPYKDYILWLMKQNRQKAVEYWKNCLSGVTPTILRDKPIAKFEEYGETIISFNEGETNDLNCYAKTLEITSNTLLQGILGIYLSKYKKQEDLIFGVTVSGRNIELPRVEDMVGIFINTLPIRVEIKASDSIKDFLKKLQIFMIEAQSYGYIPLSTIQSLSNERNLFDCIYVFENYPVNTEIINDVDKRNKLLIKTIQIVEKTEYKLSIAVIPKKDNLEIKLNFDKRYFNEDEIQKISIHLRQMVFNIIRKEHQMIGNISLLDEIEETQIFKWNNTHKNYPKSKLIHHEFEEIAKNNKNKAVVYEGKCLSYQELNERANQLAHYLKEEGVQPETLVSIICECSLEMIVGIFGILKAGGAYVPIDPNYPTERIRFIIEDTKPAFLVIQKSVLDKLNNSDAKLIVLDKEIDKISNYPTTDPVHTTQPDHLAYVIYTSGSTGNPRGVMINHGSLYNSIKAQGEFFGIQHHKHMLQFASYTFDASVFEIFLALTSGVSLFLFNRDKILDSDAFVQFANDHMIEFMALPPSFVVTLKSEQFPYLKTLIMGGEPPSFSVILQWQKNRQLINAYGPTECTICTTAFNYQKNFWPSVIGKPIANTQVYVLDSALNPVPIGVIGELYIGGKGIARGYLNRPGVTAERFLPNPFVKEVDQYGSRLYKTGDLARYLADGTLEFLGRIDNQVKLRGFRIELGEIESTLQCVEGVTQSIIMIREDVAGHKRLVAYIVIEKQTEKSETQEEYEKRKIKTIKKSQDLCKSRLPDYMQPSHIVILEHLPLTLTGKIDKNALPKPKDRMDLERYEEPAGELEQQLAKIWREILKIDKVGRNDNFFSLGGDSIISIQMVSRAREKGIIFDVKQVFEVPTIAGLIMNAKKLNKTIYTIQTDITGSAPLLSIQQWFFENAQNMNHFNQACWMIPKNMTEGQVLNISELKNSLEKITTHHDAFKIKFRKIKDKSFEQYYSDNSDIPFEIIHKNDWNEDGLEKVLNEIQSSLNIEKGPLSKVVYFEGKGLFWVIHHLIIDGVSWRILIEDLNALYEGKELPEKTHSYKAWAEYLTGYNDIGATVEYYKTNSQIKLPLEQSSQRILYKTIFSKEITKNFIQEAQKAYNTQANDLLLTALVLALGKYSNYQLCVDLEGHGREPLDSNLDLTRTIGWFTSVFPVHLMLSEPDNLDKCIKEIKEQLRQVPGRGITYGIARFIKKQIPQLAIDISFNYLGQWDTIDLEGSTFRFSNEKIGHCTLGNSKLFHNLDILGQIKGGVLSFEWESNYEESVVREVADNFKEKLEALIMHCMTDGVYGYTPSDFELVKLPQDKLDTIFHIPLEAIYPLSPIQGGLLFQSLYQPESDSYFIQSVFELINLSVDSWKQAWNTVIHRYDSLRASFIWQYLDEPVQVIQREVALSWIEENWGEIFEKDASLEVRLKALLETERKKGFDLSKAPLMRFNLIQANNKYYFVWNMHHLLTDGWSGSIVLKEVLEVYHSKHQTNLITRRPFKHYLSWILRQDQDKAKRYWEQSLLGVVPTKLTGDRQAVIDEKYGEVILKLSAEESHELSCYAKSIEVTPNTILQAIWGILLSKYLRQTDVAFGVVVSGRNIELSGIESMVGIFINTLPVRMKFKPYETIKGLMSRLQEQMIAIQENGYLPLSTIQSLQNEGNLFDNIFVFENYPISYNEKKDQGDKLSIKLFKVLEKTEYKLSLTIVPAKQLEVRLSYDERYFSRGYIYTLSHHLYQLILSIIRNEFQYIGNISLITKKELTLCQQWNDTELDYSIDKCVHEFFEELAENNKDRIAAIYKDQQVTFEVLNQRANQLGHFLKKNQVRVETLVGICIPRNIDLIIGFLGILKSGGVYVPLDPEYPVDRLESMLEDAGIQILLTTADLKEKFKGYKGLTIFLDHKEYLKESINNLNTKMLPDNLAYVIYTSGSTGKSKGVAIKHRSLINNIFWHSTALKITNARVLQRASSSFDASVWEIALPLLKAHSLIILPGNNDVLADDLNNFIAKYQCNIIQMTPALIEIFKSKGNRFIEQIIVGGEALSLEHTSIIKQNLPDTLLHNVYGATESCIDASYWLVDKDADTISVGKALHNMQVYILDEYLNPVPIGVIGEIYIGGVGLARGYLNRPGLTAERFLPNPFTEGEDVVIGTRIYRTGDLGRYLDDGNIEYIGRADYQVKIRGFRIELGEIESVLLDIQEVKQCVVVIREDVKNQKRLVAYIVPEQIMPESNGEDQKIRIVNECRRICKLKLPDYMQPSQIMVLETLPLTINGKVDRKALLRPGDRDGLNKYESPRNEQEQLICEAFSKILKMEKIGIHDDFFILGGNSIQVIHLVVILQANFDVKVKDIFVYRTPKNLAQYARFDKSVLVKNLQKIKLISQNEKNKIKNEFDSDEWADYKVNNYQKNFHHWRKKYYINKPIKNVLLTGATGFLGCNILNQLLNLTNYRIYLMIRANSRLEATDRINKKFRFYFNKSLEQSFNTRIFVYEVDIEKEKLGLSSSEYVNLADQVDSVIHAAALVKHYGDWDAFYSANVKATINMLDFAKLTRLKDFHYVSTCSVLSSGFISNSEGHIYTEDDFPDSLNLTDNVYVQTKLLSEREVVKYRDDGIKGNIYRVGNLAFMSEDSRIQENIEDSAFLNWLKCLLHIKCFTEEANEIEISPTDETACAIVKLFDKQHLNNGIYHLFNPYFFNVAKAVNHYSFGSISCLPKDQFIDNIIQYLNDNFEHDLIIRFLLHQGWLEERGYKKTSPIKIYQEKTNMILQGLNFSWSPITQAAFEKCLKQLKI